MLDKKVKCVFIGNCRYFLERQKSQHKYNWRAFTLVELLVVISIIALLMGILMPALSRARESAKSVACKSNIGNLSMALAGYAMDNDDMFPSVWVNNPDDEPPSGYWYSTWWYWPQIARSYIGEQYELARCSRGNKLDMPVQGNYGLNLNIVGNGNPNDPTYQAIKYSSVKHPGNVILLCDSGTFYAAKAIMKNPRVGFEYIPGCSNNVRWASKWPTAFTKKDAIDGRHPNKTVNIGFVDCHADSLPAESLLEDDHWKSK